MFRNNLFCFSPCSGSRGFFIDFVLVIWREIRRENAVRESRLDLCEQFFALDGYHQFPHHNYVHARQSAFRSDSNQKVRSVHPHLLFYQPLPGGLCSFIIHEGINSRDFSALRPSSPYVRGIWALSSSATGSPPAHWSLMPWWSSYSLASCQLRIAHCTLTFVLFTMLAWVMLLN